MLRSTLLACLLLASPSLAGDPGAVLHFDGGNVFGLDSGQSTIVGALDGGAGGAGNGYAVLSTLGGDPANLGANVFLAEFTGNLTTSGITGFAFWLRDVGADEPIEVRVGFGTAFSNVWLSNERFTPPANGWQRFEVDVTDQSKWTRIKGNGSFANAKANCNRLVFRHDTGTPTEFPEKIVGDFGIDRITALPCAYEVYGVDASDDNVLDLDTDATATVGQTQTLRSRGSLGGATGFLVASPADADLPGLGGKILVNPTLALLIPIATDGAGDLSLPLTIPNDPLLYDFPIFFQALTRDAGTGSGWRLSNGLTTTFCAP